MRFVERRKSRPISPTAWRRLRVSEAHELPQRLNTVPAIAGVLFLLSGSSLALRYPETAFAIMAVNCVGALALFAFRPIARIATPRGMAGLALLMPAVAALTMAGMIAVEPEIFPTAMASLAITPIAAPLLLGWDARTNLRFALTYCLAVSIIAVATGFGTMSIGQRLDLASLVATWSAVGVLAGNLLQRLRLRSIEQELDLRRLIGVLHAYATTDSLTRLRNRRQLDVDVAVIWPSMRRNASGAVVMLDLDHFKRLNDERGHAAGDSTLRLVAMELQRQVRGRDSVYRVGGEEFLVLLRDTTLDGGMQVADRIRLSIAELGLPSSGGANPVRLTVSGGVAVADQTATSWDAVVATADAALYAAKEAGRDRVFGPDWSVVAA